jgi:hypothetical protein
MAWPGRRIGPLTPVLVFARGPLCRIRKFDRMGWRPSNKLLEI